MNSTPDEMRELLLQTGEQLTEDYFFMACDFLDKLDFSGNLGPPIPLLAWEGILQAFADYAGYRIVLQAEILEPVPDTPNRSRLVGHKEILTVEPRIFSQQ